MSREDFIKYADERVKQKQEEEERKKLGALFRQHNIDPNGVFYKARGQWVVSHKGLEKLGTLLGIKFDSPVFVEAKGWGEFSVAILVRGVWGEKETWTIGEANIKNAKIPFPYAIAEKRAKDRIILKLLGAHGFVYSDSEIEEEIVEKKRQPNE